MEGQRRIKGDITIDTKSADTALKIGIGKIEVAVVVTVGRKKAPWEADTRKVIGINFEYGIALIQFTSSVELKAYGRRASRIIPINLKRFQDFQSEAIGIVRPGQVRGVGIGILGKAEILGYRA